MSRDWTAEELQAASAAMKAMGHMGYEEFCESLKEVRRMELRVNLNGKNRKDLVAAIAELTGEQAVYMMVPTCAYKIGAFTVGKFGSLTIPVPRLDPEKEKEIADRVREAERLRDLANKDFIAERNHIEQIMFDNMKKE